MGKPVIIPLLVLTIVLGCSRNGSGLSDFVHSTSSQYFKTVTDVEIEVHYEVGAEPYVGNLTLDSSPVWSILEANLIEIFSYREAPPSVVVPSTLVEMSELPAQSKETWSADEVLALYVAHHNQLSTSEKSLFYIYFLNGYAEEGQSIIGFNISGTPVIAIFKDVIEASGGLAVRRFVEQSTLVHEMGHALGLVNAGIPMAVSHQDTEHGHHTTDSDCVMFWLNEGIEDLKDFIGPFVTENRKTMWGSEVLADVEAFSE